MSAPSRLDRALRVAGLALLIVVAAWAGARLHTLLSSPRPIGGIRVPVGEASAPTPSDLSAEIDPLRMPPKIPDRLPDFTLADRTGQKTSIRAFEGRSLVVNFWATWCEPCRREIPLLESLQRAWSSRGVTVIGIAVDERTAVLDFARSMKIDYPLLIGEEDALEVAARLGFESPAFPFTVFTDRHGELVALFVGELHSAQASLILGQVEALDRGQVGLAEARRAISSGLEALGHG